MLILKHTNDLSNSVILLLTDATVIFYYFNSTQFYTCILAFDFLFQAVATILFLVILILSQSRLSSREERRPPEDSRGTQISIYIVR